MDANHVPRPGPVPAVSRRPNVLVVAIVLAIAAYAALARIDAGIAVAVLGLVVAQARPWLATPVAAFLAIGLTAPGSLATVALVLAGVGAVVGILSLFVNWSLGMGGVPSSSMSGSEAANVTSGAWSGGDYPCG